MKPRVFFYVQHLLGIGHLRRAAILARVLAADGFDVLLVSGGAPIDLVLGGARLHQLPPVRARDENLRELSRLDGSPLDENFRAARRAELLDLLRAEAPAIVITEQFPFGRTQLRFELLPLLEAARALTPRPLIVSSVRDLVRRSVSAARVAETIETFAAFDLLMIHGDSHLVGFDKSFAGWEQVRSRAVYTGYVTDADLTPTDSGEGTGEVIVSVGGGAVGAPLLEAARAARALSVVASRRWCFLENAERGDFVALLRNSTLSISQAGYNTVVETLCCADRAVLVPFGSERETEQTDRARLLADRGMVAMVPYETLTPQSLAAAVDRAMRGPSIRSFPPCDARGADATVALLRQRLA